MGEPCVAQHDRHDGMRAFFDLESFRRHRLPKIARVPFEFFSQLGARAQQIDRLHAGRDDRGGERIRKEIGSAPLPQERDDLFPTAGEPARGTTECFAQGGSNDVHPLGDAEELRCSSTRLTHETGRVSIIHHHQRLVSIGELTDGVERSEGSVHAEDTVGGDEPHPGRFGFLQLAFEISHVGVLVTKPLRLRKTHPVDDARMIELVADHGVFLGEKSLE